jgi:hypothetical protein
MMSSFASVLVAKAKATPENVVPYLLLADRKGSVGEAAAYKIDADD